ncbi:TetR/AcrR family transcriptional regulator [Caballeronia mineralivorans]|jgi:TetR/AcrR family transcriptional repressor of nem operon|uniref:TetR/AcrR family transcriptional regulator n=1 Tax=Caballeronia mineralivorans TaxID=2010198 RepID=UPI0023EFDC66|nr:TetR/AcrR family transcriptional regulator [Caballeronia mineralivorans]MDB5785468.1 TetR family transcriptional regulator [Caballeronia mineralivorans]MEA3101905.1 TetR/AcrR family transcriptional regulator, transcriptional repressor for nem operon [Caballeronia mineralivorans]
MGVSRQQAIENRQSIIAAAEKLFRERGVDAVGLTELTKAAGFTQGGFYNHFESKDALVAAVMSNAMEDGKKRLVAALEQSKALGLDPIKRQIDWYLSPDHRRAIDSGCPVSTFAGDVRRLSAGARKSYAEGVASNVECLADALNGANKRERRKKAIAVLSQLVGTLVLSRALVDADPDLADEILKDGRRELLLDLADS